MWYFFSYFFSGALACRIRLNFIFPDVNAHRTQSSVAAMEIAAGPVGRRGVAPSARRARGARGLGGRGRAVAPPPLLETHTDVAAYEFLVGMHGRPRSKL